MDNILAIVFGRKSDRQLARERLEKNKKRGKAGENLVKLKYWVNGWEMERTGRGSDFIARKRSFWSGKVLETKRIEVKTGKAKLSELQKKTRKRGHYKVERTAGIL